MKTLTTSKGSLHVVKWEMDQLFFSGLRNGVWTDNHVTDQLPTLSFPTNESISLPETHAR
jgi:hypothetical protein